MKSKLKFCLSLILILLLFNSLAFADDMTSETTCTHAVYDDTDTGTYHYEYCSICGECDYRSMHYVYSTNNISDSSYHTGYCSCGVYMGKYSHDFSYSNYSSVYHIKKCECGYSEYQVHEPIPKQISLGETVNGKTYSTLKDLDTAHKLVCSLCSRFLSTESHNWGRGDTLAHMCINCNYVHSKKNDATKRTTLF